MPSASSARMTAAASVSQAAPLVQSRNGPGPSAIGGRHNDCGYSGVNGISMKSMATNETGV